MSFPDTPKIARLDYQLLWEILKVRVMNNPISKGSRQNPLAVAIKVSLSTNPNYLVNAGAKVL